MAETEWSIPKPYDNAGGRRDKLRKSVTNLVTISGDEVNKVNFNGV